MGNLMPSLARRFAPLFASICMVAVANQASAHGGGLNSEGCHNNRKTGDYHCHRAPASRALTARRIPVAQDDAGSAAPRRAAASNGQPQCFTGPRGGTYTITASGRKNYSGC
jgi:hypothetical protein